MEEDDQCRDCKRETNMILDSCSGDVICEDCGLVLEERTVETNYYHKYVESDEMCETYERKREVSNPFLQDSTLYLGTMVKKEHKSYEYLLHDSISSLHLFEKFLCFTPSEEILIKSFEIIEDLGEQLCINMADMNQTYQLCRNVLKQSSVNLTNYPTVAAACLFVSCGNGNRLSLDTIRCYGEEISRNDLSKEIMKLTKQRSEKKITSAPREEISPKVFIKRFCGILHFPTDFTRIAYQVALVTEGIDLRRSPISIAAAVIYFTSNEPRETINNNLLEQISRATGVSTKTIMDTFRELLKHEALLVAVL